jgi:hypothetical protein
MPFGAAEWSRECGVTIEKRAIAQILSVVRPSP